MIRKVIAVVIFGFAFWVFFIDELYRLENFEWVPNILGPILIVASMYVWNPDWLQRSQRKPKPSNTPESDQEPDAS